MMNGLRIDKFQPHSVLRVDVPASKSVLNRALLLAAFSHGNVFLRCGRYSGDTRALLDCLASLGIVVESTDAGLLVHGCGGVVPNRNATLNVGSAGTAARFLTAILAFCGGDYELTASAQMTRRPMDLIIVLSQAGVTFDFHGEVGHFPFHMHSEGVTADRLTLDTAVSTQYASGVLLAAACGKKPFSLEFMGERISSSYLNMTVTLLQAFGAHVIRDGNLCTVFSAASAPSEYAVEPDISGACYFYALSLLLGAKVLVRGVKRNSLQGDIRFFDLLEERGVVFTDTDEGLLADGSSVVSFAGFDVDMQDFSDQTLTVAAIAPFATTPSVLRNVEHIRRQECDRMLAITENLTALGVPARSDEKTLYIEPAIPKGGTVRTFDDHRVAMAFSLIGLKNGGIIIDNPDCVKKTFDHFFELLSSLR